MAFRDYLVFVHSAGDIIIWLTYTLISVIGIMAYRKGHVSSLGTPYSRLWQWGVGFILFCALTRLGEAFEYWTWGWVYALTALVKVVTAVCATGFVVRFLRVKDEIIAVLRILNGVKADKKGGINP